MMNFGCGGGMMLLAVVFWVAVVIGVALVFRSMGGSGKNTAAVERRDPAIDIARARFARGEITREELDLITRSLT